MRKICLRCDSKFGYQADYCPHDGTLLVTDDEVPDALIGTVLLEQFRIDALIGTGGMGTVYRARQTTVGRDVAVKVLRIELARDENAVLRFEREARLATSLDHPNLVQVFLSGRLSDGRIYIVMELLDGRSLADELDQHGVPSVERALVMVMKLCAGLGAVHAQGIVHRDIKPENVYLVHRGTDEDFVKLVDFGISRALGTETVNTESQSGRVFGTAAYISPEAATGDPTDRRSDIYSIGVLTYQLLTGELPFEGKTAGAVLMQHVHEEPPPMHTKGRGEDVPRAVAQVVMHALAKEPDVRFQTLPEFVDALAEAAVDAGLLTNARSLLLGTVWGDELAAPGSFLAGLLGASSLPGAADTLALARDRNTEDEALLTSAPKPFGTSSFETAKTGDLPRRRQRRLWASLGALALVLVGAVAGTWWLQRAQRTILPKTVAAEEPTVEEPVADIGTDQPQERPLVIPKPEPEPETKPTKKKRRRPARRRTAPASEPVSAPESAPAPESPRESPEPATEDDDIDWTPPGFDEEPTNEPPAPRNPIVIDEVPRGHAPPPQPP